MTRFRGWALNILIILLTLIIGWTVFAYATDRATSNEDILIEMRVQSCILSVSIEDRSEAYESQCRRQAEASLP
jgi:hypothetical protein